MTEQREKLIRASINWYDAPTFAPPDNYIGITSNGNVNPEQLDRMEIPKSFKDKLKLIRFFYSQDPIASTVINKIVEIGTEGLYLESQGTETEESKLVSEAFLKRIKPFFEECFLEYLISGLVVPQVSWVKKPGSELIINKKLRQGKSYQFPEYTWLLDPGTVLLKDLGIGGKILAEQEIQGQDTYFILHNGVYENGEEDKELYNSLIENFPEYVKSIKDGKVSIPIENSDDIIRRRVLSNDVYPTPYLLSALESLAFKRRLKSMDYAIAARVIGAIQLFRLGDKDFPLLEEDSDQIDALKTEILWRGKTGNVEKVFQLFANHTLQIDWVYPDTESMINTEKYDAVNEDIFYALGFPRILVSGETLRSSSSSAEYAMFSPASTIRNIQDKILCYFVKLLEELRKRNGFRNVPILKFAEVRLYDVEKLVDMAKNLYEKGGLSLSTYAKMLGYSIESELLLRASERKRMEELGLPEFNPLPYSNSPNIPGGTNQNEPKNPDNKGTNTPNDETPKSRGRPKKPKEGNDA